MLGRRCRFISTGLILALLAAAPAAAGSEVRAKKALKDARLSTTKLFGLDWHKDWKAAVVRNRLAPKDSRPIMFLRILGDLAAGT